MGYLVNLSVAEKPAVVAGGGHIAARKVNDLLESGAHVTVVAPAVSKPIEELAAKGRIVLHLRPYSSGDLCGAMLAVAATDDEELNAAISRDAQSLGFTVPAVLRRGDLTIAVSTEGQCPAFASAIREELADRFGEDYADIVRTLGSLRREWIRQGWDGDRIRAAVRDFYRGGLVPGTARGSNPRALHRGLPHHCYKIGRDA